MAEDGSMGTNGLNGSVFRRSPRVEYRAIVDEGGVLLHLDTASYHGLNPVGALTWELLDGGTSLPDLVEQLRGQLDDEVPATLDQEVAEFVAALVERKLVLKEPFDG